MMAKTAVQWKVVLPTIARCYAKASTAPHPSTTKTTEATDSHGLTAENISRIYCAPLREAKEVFPRGLPQKYRTQIECFKNMCWILRAQTYDIISHLRGDQEASARNFLLHGRDGSGKTICLDQVVHWCWKAGWLIVHVPGVAFWTQSRKELRPSQLFPGTYDQPHEATIWLKNFRSVNANILKTLKLSEPQTWTKRESSEVGEPLWNVIDQGLRKPVIATDVVGVIIKELLKDQTRSEGEGQKHKLLLAMDEANGFFNPCAASVSKFEQLEPKQLNLVRYMTQLIPVGKFPGAVVASLSRHRTYHFSAPTTSPSDLLGKEGMQHFSDYRHLEVGNFSRQELINLLTYYQDCKWITKEPFERVVDEMWLLTEGNPSEVTKLSCML